MSFLRHFSCIQSSVISYIIKKNHHCLKMFIKLSYWFVFILLLITKSTLQNKISKAKKTNPKAASISCSCGKSGGGGKTRIVGGKISDNHIYPWMGAMIFTGNSKPAQYCGSSLINDRYVLTAGHCVVGSTGSINNYKIYLGSNNLNGSDVKPSNIAAILLHPQYNPNTLDYDLALIRLSEPVKFTAKIRPVCLTGQGGPNFVGKIATVAGWGTLRKDGNSVNKLRDTNVRVLDNAACAKNYSNAKDAKITPNMICASLPGRDSCSGDSGGPLVINQGSYRQIGIVSFGIDCGNAYYPGVYTRVSRFSKFIRDNTRDAKYCSK